MRIRPAGPDDAEAVGRLSGELGYPVAAGEMTARFVRILGDASHLLLVAEEGTAGMDGAVGAEASDCGAGSARLVGWLHAWETCSVEGGRRVEIAGLVVGRDARKRGIGRALVARCEAWAGARGAPVVVVRTQVTRTESHAFYAALGYAHAKTQAVYRKPPNALAG